MEQKTIQEITRDILLQLGIPSSINGNAYIVEAVKIASQDKSVLSSITKKLYPTIATNHNTKPANVERAIRHAIDISWEKGRIVMINSIFHIPIYDDIERPKNSELIALFVEKIPKLVPK